MYHGNLTKDFCVYCSEIMKEESPGLLCVICKKWAHMKCTGLGPTEVHKLAYDILFGKNNKGWNCPRCRQGANKCSVIVPGDPHDDTLLAKWESLLEKHLEKHLTPFKKTVENSLASIQTELSKIAKQNDTLSAQCSTLQKQVKVLETKLSDNKSNSEHPIIPKVNDRKNKREHNVIVRNRLAEDQDKIMEAPPQAMSGKFTNIKLQRFGRPVGGVTRPLLIDAPSISDARALIETNLQVNPTLYSNLET